MRFEKGEKKLTKMRIWTQVDRVKKTATHTLLPAPLDQTVVNSLL